MHMMHACMRGHAFEAAMGLSTSSQLVRDQWLIKIMITIMDAPHAQLNSWAAGQTKFC